MTLRRRIAERIATPLKRAGIETPIIEAIPHKAAVLHEAYFELVHQGGQSRGQIAELIRIPVFAHGKAYGETAGLWYRVTFPRTITNPSVVCVGEGRTTTIRKRIVEKIPDVTIPKIDIPELRIKWYIPTADDFINGIKQFLGDWGFFNWIRDAIAWAYGNAQYWGYSTFTKPWQERMNEILDSIYSVFDAVRSRINDVVNAANERIETIRSRVNEVTGDIIPAIYDAWGIPHIMALTPIHIRNVTSTGFEFQSFGKTTAYWIATGTRS